MSQAPISKPAAGPMISQEELYARKKLLAGALNLVGAGTLGVVQWMMMLIDLGLNHQVHRQDLLNKGMTQEAITRIFTTQAAWNSVLLILCLFIVWAGMNALVAVRRKTVIAGAILAMVPIITWFGCVFGLIGGVWVLVVVFRNEGVKKVMQGR
jgi:hypothetical protein